MHAIPALIRDCKLETSATVTWLRFSSCLKEVPPVPHSQLVIRRPPAADALTIAMQRRKISIDSITHSNGNVEESSSTR